jgi:predicted transcriptional regulator
MTVSVRMDPLLERELDQAARRKGITKSQFIIEAVQRALGRHDPYALFLASQQEAAADRATPHVAEPFAGEELPYDTEASRQALIAKLRRKHGLGAD